MNELPPDNDAVDEVDDLYRRVAARDASRPSESVRRSILNHAAEVARERAAQHRPTDINTARRATKRTYLPAILGTLAAAILGGLVVIRVWTPPPPSQGDLLETNGSMPPAAAPAPTPAGVAPPRLDAPAAKSAREPVLGESSERLANVVTAQKAAPSAQSAPSKLAAPPAFSAPPAPPAPPAPAPAPRAEELAPSALESQFESQQAQSAASVRPSATPLSIQARQRMDPNEALRRAAQAGDMPALNQTLAQPVDVNGRDAAGRTALMLAILQGQGGAVDALLAHGADPNAVDATGTTPLQAAKDRADPSIVAALRRAGAIE